MDKFDYLAHMFNIRTYHKKYENFVVNAIYSKIGNPELVPVTQQYVRSTTDPRKYYLLDLYFPQLNYGIEVDERHHLAEDNMILDKVREEDIRSAISCEEGRIAIYKKDNNDQSIMQSYEEISQQIDFEVEKIKKLISEKQSKGNAIKWQSNDDLKTEIINKRRLFCISDEVDYNGITEIYNITGHKAKQLRRCFYKLNKNYYLWVPTMAIKLNDGNVISSNSYENYLSENGKEIIEIDTKGTRFQNIPPKDYDKGRQRVVFMKMRDVFGKKCIRFVGVFKEDFIDSKGGRHYKRTDDKINIDKLLPD